MTQIELCKKCTKRAFDLKQGVLCGLTQQKPVFIETCPDYEADTSELPLKNEALRPNEQRGKIALSLIWIVLLLEILSLISSGLQYQLLEKVGNGEQVSNAVLVANDLREQVIGVVYLIAYIISGITFIRWFRRAYYNLHQRVDHLAESDGWAAGAWFVPVLNLFRPYQIMKELYTETRYFILRQDPDSELALETKFLGLWWTLWLVNGFLGQIIFQVSKDAKTLAALQTVTVLNLVGGFIGIALAFVTIRVLKDYFKAEKSFFKLS